VTTLLALAALDMLASRLHSGRYDRMLLFLAPVGVFPIFDLSFFTNNARDAVIVELPSACSPYGR
jgi:hypothetical protein